MEPKTLHRVEQGKMLGGVCTGIAKYFNMDPTIIRVLFVILFLFGSAGGLLYLILWLLLPADNIQVYSSPSTKNNAKEDKVVIDAQETEQKVE